MADESTDAMEVEVVSVQEGSAAQEDAIKETPGDGTEDGAMEAAGSAEEGVTVQWGDTLVLRVNDGQKYIITDPLVRCKQC